MARLAPPPPPPATALADDDSLRRLAERMRTVLLSLLIVLATVWCFTLGIVPGVLALMVAKHILVAMLAMRLGVDQEETGRISSEA
jgi:hypothetical protein